MDYGNYLTPKSLDMNLSQGRNWCMALHIFPTNFPEIHVSLPPVKCIPNGLIVDAGLGNDVMPNILDIFEKVLKCYFGDLNDVVYWSSNSIQIVTDVLYFDLLSGIFLANIIIHYRQLSVVAFRITDNTTACSSWQQRKHRWPLLLTWFNFNPSMDK